MEHVSLLMQQLQTKLVDDGVSVEHAATIVEYTIGWHFCEGLEGTLEDKLSALLNYKIPRHVVSGGFVWSESPEGHKYWAAIGYGTAS